MVPKMQSYISLCWSESIEGLSQHKQLFSQTLKPIAWWGKVKSDFLEAERILGIRQQVLVFLYLLNWLTMIWQDKYLKWQGRIFLKEAEFETEK